MAFSSVKVRRGVPGRDPALGPRTARAEELAREFGAPVGLFDPGERVWRVRVGAGPEMFPEAESVVLALADSDPVDWSSVRLWRPEPGKSAVWLVLPMPSDGQGELWALVGFACPPGLTDPNLPSPERALRAWGQSVADRLRGSDSRLSSTSPVGASESRRRPLPDLLTRRFRVSDPPERFQRMAVSALRDDLGVEAVAWVPGLPREPIILAGEVAGLTPEVLRGLLAVAPTRGSWIVNKAPASQTSVVRRLAAVSAESETAVCWLVALNPRDDRSFGQADIELLHPVASLISAQRGNARLYSDLKELLFGVIRALTSAIDAKDPYTCGHSERVARIAVRLGEELGLAPQQRSDLYLMGLLHDVGKIGIDDSVLKKTGALTPEEYRQIQSHVEIGVRILNDLKKLSHILPGVAHHHENYDGTGYPFKLAGEGIPLPARILAVADAFDAMSSTRPYRRRLTPTQIDEIFRKGSGTQWDPLIVSALFASRWDLEQIRQKGLGESLHQVVDETIGRA